MRAASPLQYHHGEEFYSCRGCSAAVEVPHRLQSSPEERLAWLEELERAHAGCLIGAVLGWPKETGGSARCTA